ncbi:hypothetical protein [Limosilactobacillus mucosae]|uniref:hypothetical protein n=1 Tax=Limosilactobacillus mucosae TaxID=97478 RepID=UPI0022E43A54|nr:hypothetical protein [Limosilactobacillus mucosae]
MYREIIIRDEKGNIKRHTNEHLLTEKQWLKKQRQLRKNATGEWISWTNQYGGGQALYFSEKETKAISKTERIRREKAKKKARLEAEKKRQLELEYENARTSYQWLHDCRRKITNPDNGFHTEKYRYDDSEINDDPFYLAKMPYYYYLERDTEPVSDEEYERLKQAYIKEYGGWEHIDLDNTKYNGKPWY